MWYFAPHTTTTSYFGIMSSFDVKLFPEFDGSDGACVLEWIEKIEMVCTVHALPARKRN